MNPYDILKQYYGYEEFRPLQKEIIDSVLSMKNTIAILPTGGGKSITYQIPALLFEGLSIVISPLIALMKDQVQALEKKGIPASCITSASSREEQEAIYSLLKKSKIKLLYVSPERLESPFFIKRLEEIKISFITIDEAHTILWAEDFRKAFGKIKDFIYSLKTLPCILALTATATPSTIEKIKNYLDLKNPVILSSSVDRANIYFRVLSISQKLSFLLRFFKKINQKALIYCLTRKKVEEIYTLLEEKGYNVTFYHGGLESQQKIENQEAFTAGKKKIMICTNAFGMGIDIPDIRYVILYEIPWSLEDLVQQIGRVSRDGTYGEGIILYSFQDLEIIRYFIETIEQESVRKEHHKKLKTVVDFCVSKKCRHQFIGNYFNENLDACKTLCDNCQKRSRILRFFRL